MGDLRVALVGYGYWGANLQREEELLRDVYGHDMDRVDKVTPMKIIGSDYYGTGAMPQRDAILLRNRWRLKPQMQEVNS